MRAANTFVARLAAEGQLARTARVRAEMFGSLGVTGHGHGTVKAVVLGLEGEQPDLVDPEAAESRVAAARTENRCGSGARSPRLPMRRLVLHRRHGCRSFQRPAFTAWDATDNAMRGILLPSARILLDQTSSTPRSRETCAGGPPRSARGELLRRPRDGTISDVMSPTADPAKRGKFFRAALCPLFRIREPGIRRPNPPRVHVRGRRTLLEPLDPPTTAMTLRAMEWSVYALRSTRRRGRRSRGTARRTAPPHRAGCPHTTGLRRLLLR